MKKALCFLLAATLALGLCACGSTGAPATSAAYAPASEAAAAESVAGDAAAPGAYEDYDSEGQPADDDWRYAPTGGEEEYDESGESPFVDVATSPLSTFSSDVDTASYSNMRRFINQGAKPEGVRIEELVNYFDYDYARPDPGAEHPFSVSSEVAPCPWNKDHLLAMVGVQGAELEQSGDIANNIVFLLDVSGSMDEPNKLPLLRESFLLLLDKLGENDVISIVTYAGSDQIVADGVHGDEKRLLKRSIEDLDAGGSTAGAQGLQTAYELAEAHYIEGGNNRIILATDGDFNVGPSSTAALQRMVEEERDKGIFISVLGFGMYNLKDNTMETIADHGNGNYAYIDTIEEARKVLVDEFDSTMFTIAKDLKFQVEFNPAAVSQYRLIGYNNRRMANEDFNNDEKDAGDVGAGHSVTVFYELVPAGEGTPGVDSLQYQAPPEATGSDDFMFVKIRYKQPDSDESQLYTRPVPASTYSEYPSRNFAFASAVAEYGLILTDSQYKGDASLTALVTRAKGSRGEDPYGLRAEFVELVDEYQRIAE